MVINKPDAIAAVVNFALAVTLFSLTAGQVESPPTILGMTSEDMAPTVFPRMITAIWALISVWNLLASFSRSASDSTDTGASLALPSRAAMQSLAITLGAAILYASLLVPLGFVLASVLTIAGLSVYYGARKPLRIAIAAIAVPMVMYVTFTRLLLVSLPPFPYFGLGF